MILMIIMERFFLYDINELVEKNLAPKINVYVDTPMGIRVTEVFKRHPECYDKKILELLKSGDNPFSFPGLKYTNTVKESIKLNNLHEPCIIIAGSGMCTGGRIKHHIKHNIWNKRNTWLLHKKRGKENKAIGNTGSC